MLRADWVFAMRDRREKDGTLRGAGDFTNIITLYQNAPDSTYKTDMVKTLATVFWHRYRRIVIGWCFIPFVVYAYLCINFFSQFVVQGSISSRMIESEAQREFWENFVVFGVFVLWAYFTMFEIHQLKTQGWDYFISNGTILHMNTVDYSSCLLNLFLLAEHQFGRWFDVEMASIRVR